MRGTVPPGYTRKRRGSSGFLFGSRLDRGDANRFGKSSAVETQIGRARGDGVICERNPDLDHLLAALGAIEGGIEKGHHSVGSRAQPQGIDARRRAKG